MNKRSPASLLEDDAWLRRIARHLVSDAAKADDLVQQTWVVALEKQDTIRSRGFLAGVLRNLTRDDRRRRFRQGETQLPDMLAAAPSSAIDALTQRSDRELVAGALKGLDEKFRTPLELYYVEGKSSVEIAHELKLAEGTVRWRMTRGRELLRARLERSESGERWLSAILALPGAGTLAGAPAKSARVAARTGRMLHRGWLGVAGLLASLGAMALLALWASSGGAGAAGDEEVGAATSAGAEAPELGSVADAAPPIPDEDAAPAPPATSGGGAESPASTEPLDAAAEGSLRFVSKTGDPVQGVRLYRMEGPSLAEIGASDARGRVEFTIRAGDNRSSRYLGLPSGLSLRALPPRGPWSKLLHFADPRRSSLRDGNVEIEVADSATRRDVELRILGPDGESLPGAKVVVLMTRFVDHALDKKMGGWTTDAAHQFRADEKGVCVLTGLPDVPVTVRVGAPGLPYYQAGLPNTVSGPIPVQMAAGGRVVGSVTDPLGQPVPGAVVYHEPVRRPGLPGFGEGIADFDAALDGFAASTACAADGSFVLEGLPLTPTILWARTPGREPLIARKDLEVAAGETIQWYPVLERVKPIRCELRTDSGEPAPDVRICLITEARPGPGGSMRRVATTGPDGVATFHEWLAGKGLFQSLSSAEILPAEIFTTPPTGTVKRSVHEMKLVRIAARVLDEYGAQQSTGLVILRAGSGGAKAALEESQVSIQIPEGRCDVYFHHPKNGLFSCGSWDVRSDAEAERVIRCDPAVSTTLPPEPKGFARLELWALIPGLTGQSSRLAVDASKRWPDEPLMLGAATYEIVIQNVDGSEAAFLFDVVEESRGPVTLRASD